MINIVQEILNDAKIAYKECVKSNNDILAEYLLSIIGNAKLILNSNNLAGKLNTSSINTADINSEEVEKVKRKVPRWLSNPSQYNCKILNAYMLLSNNNTMPISTSLLENNLEIDPNKFLSNFNQMKTISEKNHAKVFTEEYGQVKLWGPVVEFIVQLYNKTHEVADNEK